MAGLHEFLELQNVTKDRMALVIHTREITNDSFVCVIHFVHVCDLTCLCVCYMTDPYQKIALISHAGATAHMVSG